MTSARVKQRRESGQLKRIIKGKMVQCTPEYKIAPNVTGSGTSSLEKALIKRINNGARNYMGTNDLTDTISSQLKDDSFEIILQLNERKCGGMNTTTLLLFMVQPEVTETELKEFKEYAKSNPGKVMHSLVEKNVIPGCCLITSSSKDTELGYDLVEKQKEEETEGLISFHLTPEKVKVLVVTVPGEKSHTMFFSHQIMMEILARFHIRNMTPSNVEIVIKKCLDIFHFGNIRQIPCGVLVNGEIFEKSKPIIGDHLKRHQINPECETTSHTTVDIGKQKQSNELVLQTSTGSHEVSRETDLWDKLDAVRDVTDFRSLYQLEELQDHVQKCRITGYSGHEKDISQILLKFSSLNELELRNCELNSQLLMNLMEALLISKTQVSTLSVTSTNNLDELMSVICEIMKICQTKGLNLEESTGKDNFLRMLKENIEKHQNASFKQITNVLTVNVPGNGKEELEQFCKLDLSYNKDINDFTTLGEIVSGRIKELKMVNCDLETEKLEPMCKGISDSKVEYLDVSYNTELSEDDVRLLPKILNKDEVKLLAMRGCNLSDDELEGFDDTKFERLKVHKMDLSYNRTLKPEGVEIVGQTVRRLHTKELSLGFCSLDENCLSSLMTSLDHHDLTVLDIRGNTKIASNGEMVAKLVQQCNTRRLNISECKLGSRQISTFAKTLVESNYKLDQLNVSDSGRTVMDETFVKALCDLSRVVDKELISCFPKTGGKYKERLQKSLNDLQNKTLRVIYVESRQQKKVKFLTLVGRKKPHHFTNK